MSNSAAAGAGAGVLYVVATPIGNLEDLTFRAARILAEVELVVAEDTRAAQVLLSHHGIRKPVWSCFVGNEARRAAEVLATLGQGRRVALISEAGTPAISDPGALLVGEARRAGFPVVVLPGASATLTALLASGLPPAPFSFLGFPPRGEGQRRQRFARLRHREETLVFYEAPPRVAATLADLAAALGAERQAAVCRELTKLHEEVVAATLGELAARYATRAPRGEVTLVVAGAGAGAEQEALAAAPLDLPTLVKEALAAGRSPREIAAELALRSGQPRRAIYRLALDLRRGVVEAAQAT